MIWRRDKTHLLSILVLFPLIVGFGAHRVEAGSSISVRSISLDHEMRVLLSKTNGPSVAIAIQFGKVIGSASRHRNVSSPLHLASISKVLTATAVFRLVELGRISLEEPVSTYLPALFPSRSRNKIGQQPISAFLNHATGLTSHNLRAVTSGVTGYRGYATMASTMRPTTSAGQYEYSNDNYAILTVLVEAITGQTFESAVRDLVWKPLNVEGGYLDISTHSTRVLGGAGAWVASAYDVALLLNGLNPNSGGVKLLSPKWLAVMHQRVFSDGYRNGLRYRNGYWGHTGSLARVRTAGVVGLGSIVYVVLSEGNSPASSDRLFDALASLDRRVAR